MSGDNIVPIHCRRQTKKLLKSRLPNLPTLVVLSKRHPNSPFEAQRPEARCPKQGVLFSPPVLGYSTPVHSAPIHPLHAAPLLSSILLYSTLLLSSVLFSSLFCYSTLIPSAPLRSTPSFHSAPSHSILFYSSLLYSSLLDSILDSTLLHYLTLLCSTLLLYSTPPEILLPLWRCTQTLDFTSFHFTSLPFIPG